MGNCMSNTGRFEPPGTAALKDYVSAYDIQADPVQRELRRLRALEKSRASIEANAPAVPAKPKGPKCSVCFKHCQIVLNPWQLARSQLLMAEMSDDSDEGDDGNSIEEVPVDGGQRPRAPRRPVLHGIQLASCKHYFCGPCLAHAIYNGLNIVFNPDDYGTVLKRPTPATPGKQAEFPISCPTCQVKPGEQAVPIPDMTARLVLGEANLEEWNHAKFLSTLNLIYCPHKGCEETFDADDIAPAPSGVKHDVQLVQCPRCRGSLCKSCKCVWHENLTCAAYQALPIDERAPEDVAFANLALEHKWRRCPKCSAMVELKFGCNHITCVCKHHFCYTCGADFQHDGGKYRCTGGRGCKVWEEQNLIARD